jgi:hypothetical protein
VRKLDARGVEPAAWDARMALAALGACAYFAPSTSALSQAVLGIVLVEFALVLLTVLLLRFEIDGALGLVVAVASSFALVVAAVHYQCRVGLGVVMPTASPSRWKAWTV